MTYASETTKPLLIELSRTAAFFEKIALSFRQRRAYRETFSGLSALTNRDLSDLGLSRGDLRRVSHEAALLTK